MSSRSTLPATACPFRAATGLLCPLCGGTRAARELLNGDVGSAIALNPLALVVVPVAVAFFVGVVMIPLIRGRPIAAVRAPRWLAWASGLVLAAVLVLRNVPGAWPLPITA